MIYTGVIQTSALPGLNDRPAVWQDKYFQDVERDNISYKMIKSFSHYFTTDIINQFEHVFETEEEYQMWLNSTDIVPTLVIEQDISDYNGMQRKAVCLEFPVINFKKNELRIRLGIQHFIEAVEQKQYYKEIELHAHNGNNITIDTQGTTMLEYDFFVHQHINEGKTIPELVQSAIQMRDSDGTINTKCEYA